MKKVLGMGAALVDILANVSDEWIAAQGVQKGGMNMVDWPQMEKFLSNLEKPLRVPGGSTCNTMVGLSRLGGKAAFISKIGNDELGRLFQEHLKNNGVESRMGFSDAATGCVFSAVTPDAQRSMWTYLGASDFLGSDDFVPALYDGVGLLYAEGYRAFNGECFKKSFELARSLGVETALDFSSFNVVNACRGLFDELFDRKMIDIIIANEDEAFAYAGVKEVAALEVLQQKAKVAVVKIGKRGALIAKDGSVTRVSAGTAKAIDTTGAGDLWASGFLYGYMNGWDMERSGKLGSVVSNEVVQVMGAQIPEEGWKRINASI
ncbi:adenosine kinase [Fibrobacter sp.]|uniref:adenosine kinase n=1 Tax=Fibrobacter sp. TaxID=35828 RepID=UPI00388DEB49